MAKHPNNRGHFYHMIFWYNLVQIWFHKILISVVIVMFGGVLKVGSDLISHLIYHSILQWTANFQKCLITMATQRGNTGTTALDCTCYLSLGTYLLCYNANLSVRISALIPPYR